MTKIGWADRMNAAMEYIEEQLAGEIDMRTAARRACCSEYQFTRLFSYIADMPLNEYIRRRRLTLAGFMLQKSSCKIIEIANRFGYSSPNSFTRAFQEMHGVTPSEARILGLRLEATERMCFNAPAAPNDCMSYRIEEEGESAVFGISVMAKHEESYTAVPAFIDRCEAERITNRIVKAGLGNESTLLKSVIWDSDDGLLSYMLCLDLPPCGVSDEFEVMTVPRRTWAVFSFLIEKPGDSIISVWKRIWTEWFPNAQYVLDTGPRQERCHWREDGKMVVEAWVPVIKSAHS